MRLWSLHPKYLDRQGLLAVWREGLLAQKVLSGKTRGYTRHPQLIRFRKSGNPVGAVARYLRSIAAEAQKRGYCFDNSKIADIPFHGSLSVTIGQITYEFEHLSNKLKVRDPDRFGKMNTVDRIEVHPLFKLREGVVENWEKIS